MAAAQRCPWPWRRSTVNSLTGRPVRACHRLRVAAAEPACSESKAATGRADAERGVVITGSAPPVNMTSAICVSPPTCDRQDRAKRFIGVVMIL